MKKACLDLRVSSIEKQNEKYFLLKLTHQLPLPQMVPGQFVEVRVDHSPTTFLRRPISINNYVAEANELWLLVGGGVGVAPLLYFGKKIREAGARPTFLLGARTQADLLQLELFEKLGDVHVTTEDGSYGEKGFVTNHSVLERVRFDQISCCGPKPMMMAVARYAAKNDIFCEVSLENMMACGLGACLCCVEKTVSGNLCVCKEGPVFNIKKLLWQV